MRATVTATAADMAKILAEAQEHLGAAVGSLMAIEAEASCYIAAGGAGSHLLVEAADQAYRLQKAVRALLEDADGIEDLHNRIGVVVSAEAHLTRLQ